MNISQVYHNFRLVDKWIINEIESEMHMFEHEKSGARLLYAKNEDDNKVFSITFRTPPVDSCGTPHIMEHSVLCGSDKYPLKEPFVELVKSSMNTFLNAMTYPDKTMYPVASKNQADFENLIDVYCDAVFSPNVKHNPYTFYQEGWHYHLEKSDDPITLNGVVFNEMKGAFSDPEEIMMRHVQASLYPETPYAFESGGDPDEIPNLTYEKFMDYYDDFYHPSNSYIYFFGDMDIIPHLERLDAEYLSKYNKKTIDSLPVLQTPFAEPSHFDLDYSIDEEDTVDRNYYFSANYKIGEAVDSILSYSFNVLMNILFDSDASPLKKALIDADIADEIDFDYVTSVREPYMSIIAKNADIDKFEVFQSMINDTLRALIESGIGADMIESALNSYEFELREADSGNYPKGLIYSMDIMESWLYDEKPGIHLAYEPYLAFLRDNETSAYYEDLIIDYLLDNQHKSTIVLSPKKGLQEENHQQELETLQAYKDSLNNEEKQALINETQELIRRQSEPDSEEARNSVPVLSLDEIKERLPKPDFHEHAYNASRIFTHLDKTRGIAYIDINFPICLDDLNDVSVCGLLTNIVSVYETQKYSELELANEIGIHLGDVRMNLATHQNIQETNKFEARFCYNSKSLISQVSKLFEIAEEILLYTKIDDLKRVEKTVNEEISKFESRLITAAHQYVANRLQSKVFPRAYFSEYFAGNEYYRYLTKVKTQIEQGDTQVLDDLNRVISQIVSSYHADILITCEAKDQDMMQKKAQDFLSRLSDEKRDVLSFDFNPTSKEAEAILIPSKVMYVGLGYNYRLLSYDYSPLLIVAKKYLTSGYLWDRIRILGGAYGALMSTDNSGALLFISYRDPKLAETVQAYRDIPEELRNLKLSEKDINKLIIGTISDIDAPVPVYTVGRRMLANLYKNDTWERQQDARASILHATANDLIALADLFESAIQNANISIAGEERKIRENSELFDNIYSVTRKV